MNSRQYSAMSVYKLYDIQRTTIHHRVLIHMELWKDEVVSNYQLLDSNR